MRYINIWNKIFLFVLKICILNIFFYIFIEYIYVFLLMFKFILYYLFYLIKYWFCEFFVK